MSLSNEVNKRDLKCLVIIAAGNRGFKEALERADEATVRAALAEIETDPNKKDRELALRRQLKEILESSKETVAATKTRQDMTLVMEMAPLEAERDRQLQEKAEQTERERLIGDCYKAIGQVQAATMFGNFANVSSLVWLKQVKESKTYKDIPGIGTWDKFCDSVGMSRQKVDMDLQNLATFGEAFLLTCQQLQVGYREMRQLRQLQYDGESFQIIDDGNTVVIEGETIALGEDAAPLVEIALEKLLIKNKTLADRNRKLEKDFKGAVKEEVQSYESKEKALLKEVERLKAFDPEDKDRDWSVKQMEEIEKATGEYIILLSKFIIDPRFKDDRHLQARVSGHLQEAEMGVHDLRRRLDETIDMFTD